MVCVNSITAEGLTEIQSFNVDKYILITIHKGYHYTVLSQRHHEIKFPFKRNGLPCCEDEPGSEKIALK